MSTGAEHGLIWARSEEPPAALVDVRRPGDVRAEARSESPNTRRSYVADWRNCTN